MNEAIDRRRFDRRLFLATAVVFPLIILVGFGRTYYVKGLFDTPPLPSRLVFFHGLLMTAWVTLFVTQVWLVSSTRIRLHQRLGYAESGWAFSSRLVPLRLARNTALPSPPGILLAFLIVPPFDLLMFALLFGGAIYYRRTGRAQT